MKFGVHLPNIGPNANQEGIRAVALAAEAAGYDSVWVSDHIVVPPDIRSRYPYNETGDFPVPPTLDWLEAVSTLTYVAGMTSRVRLGTSVLILPYRNPVYTAKQVATLDVLSGGRVILGIGVGWMREEFEALSMPFDNHGPRGDEQIALMRTLWKGGTPTFEGRFYRYPGSGFAPVPIQQPLPIFVGGHEEPALRRAGRLGDGWHAAFLEPEELGERYRRVQEHAREVGRDPAAIELSARVRVDPEIGNADPAAITATVEMVRAYQAVGAHSMLVDGLGTELEQMLASARAFARHVMPAFV